MLRPRFFAVIAFACIAIAFAGCNRAGSKTAESGSAGLEGAWENVTVSNARLQSVKHFAGSKFVWVIYDRERKTTVLMGGGSWSLQGNSYREVQEYCSPGIQEQLLGREENMTVQIQGDEATFTWTTAQGTRTSETLRWMR